MHVGYVVCKTTCAEWNLIVVGKLIPMKVVPDDCEPRAKRARLCVQYSVANASVASQQKIQLAVQHGIAQVNVEQTCSSVLLTELEQLTHETYYLREVLYRARVKYTPYALYLSAAKSIGRCMQDSC